MAIAKYAYIDLIVNDPELVSAMRIYPVRQHVLLTLVSLRGLAMLTVYSMSEPG